MSKVTCISHPKRIPIENWSAIGKSEESLGKLLSWESNELDTPTLLSCTIMFHNICFFNAISVEAHKEHKNFFPEKLRFESSIDGQIWEPLLHEVDYRIGPHNRAFWNFSLISARYLKFVFLANKKKATEKYFIAFGEFQAIISGVVAISASSELDRLWVKENIIDQRSEYGWSTTPASQSNKEYIEMDIGSINSLCEVRFLSKDDPETFFPTSFQLLYSEDNISWHLLFEENGFLAEPGCWYKWRFLPVNARHVRFVITENVRTHEGKYMSQIIEMELYATADYMEKTNQAFSFSPTASALRYGLVRLALSGENKEGAVVQGNDKRLLDATTERKGIVELASNGEERENLAVQASDRRLKYATEDFSGIVRFARDGEVREKHAIQSNDSRVSEATEEELGIIKLASDGESRVGVAIQASDKRLRTATNKNAGIVRLAESGSENPNEVVQANDLRLSKATSETFGIIKYSRLGESGPGVAVQANDPRLQVATTAKEGIVRLGLDNEKKPGVAIQANDSRLNKATELDFGLVRLAPKEGTAEGSVVQAQDPRLSDNRKPLPHEHDYAEKNHTFNSHGGELKVEGEQGQPTKRLTKPSRGHAPITGINHGDGAGIVGEGKKEGVLGVSEHCGVSGLSTKSGYGLLGLARNNAAGFFLSERSYSIVAGGKLPDSEIESSDLALLAKGISRFNGSLYSYAGLGCIASYFPLREREQIAPGELIAIGDGEKGIYRSQSHGSLRIIGVSVSEANFIVNPPSGVLPDSEKIESGEVTPKIRTDLVLVAVSGIVEVKVTVEKKSIHAGDLLVSSIETGIAEVLDEDRYRPGMVFAKSLTELDKGTTGKVKAILTTI